MMTQIAVTAGEIWLEIDQFDGILQEILVKRMETKARSRDLLLMALGWLIYEGHLRWAPGEQGGRLFLNHKRKEEQASEKIDQGQAAGLLAMKGTV